MALQHEPAVLPSQGSLAASSVQASGSAGQNNSPAGLAVGPRHFSGAAEVGRRGQDPWVSVERIRRLGLLARLTMGTVAAFWSPLRWGLAEGRWIVTPKGAPLFPGQETQALTMGRELGPSSGS